MPDLIILTAFIAASIAASALLIWAVFAAVMFIRRRVPRDGGYIKVDPHVRIIMIGGGGGGGGGHGGRGGGGSGGGTAEAAAGGAGDAGNGYESAAGGGGGGGCSATSGGCGEPGRDGK